MSARLIYKRSRNAVVRVPQAPITISRCKPSVFFSPTPSCKPPELLSRRYSDGATSRDVSCDDVTLALRRHGDTPPTPSGSSARPAAAPTVAWPAGGTAPTCRA
jgi:hypothetical protein